MSAWDRSVNNLDWTSRLLGAAFVGTDPCGSLKVAEGKPVCVFLDGGGTGACGARGACTCIGGEVLVVSFVLLV